MKRFFSIFAAGMMAVALIVSCDPENGGNGGEEGDEKAPVLKAIAGAVLDAKGAPITTTYDAADFGVATSIGYELAVAKSGTDMAEEVVINADIAAGTISMKQGNLSLALQKLGFAVGDEAEVEFALYAYIGSSRGRNSLRSNLVKATFTVCAAKPDDSDLDKIEVVGNFNDWGSEGAAKNGSYLYKYGEEEVYSGLIYYAAKAVNGWKLRIPTPDGNWQDTANWGIDENELATVTAQATELYDSAPNHPEFSELNLACAGSSKDIKVFNHNFYFWVFENPSATGGKLTVKTEKDWNGTDRPYAFDYMYLVGKFNTWKEFDENYKMKYIPKTHTFYVDATLGDNDEIKFIADAQLDNNWFIAWGKDLAWESSDNIPVEKGGNYRVYFDFNHMEYSLDADAYGKDEEGGIEVAERDLDRPDQYFIVGSIMGKTWDDVDLELNLDSNTGIYTYYGLSYKVGDAFKVVKNQKVEWYGVGQGAYAGTRNTLTGTDNFEFSADGGFDVSFNPADGKVTVNDCTIPGWGVKGNIKVDGKDDGWNTTFPMKLEGGIWVSDELDIMYDGTSTWGFKLCLYGNWNAGDIGVAAGTEPQRGVPMPAVDKLATGDNSNICFNGKGKVKFDPAAMTITIE